MRVSLKTIALLLALAGPASAADPVGSLTTGMAQPLPAVADARLTELLAQHKGSPLIVNFWASWCEPCREEMPSLQRLADRWRVRGVSVLIIAVADKRDKAIDFLWEAGVILPQLHDPEQTVARAWGVRTLPTTLVLDRRHRIVARGRGAIDWDDAAVETKLQTLLK